MLDDARTDPAGVPEVTVIVVTYRHERFVEALLASIDAQSAPPRRVILCDDASPDASAALLGAWAAATPLDCELLLSPTNRGLTATLNTALQRVHTPYYAYIAGDDLMRPDRLQTQLEAFAARPGLGFVYSDARVVDEEGVEVAPSFVSRLRGTPPEDTFEALLRGNWVPAPSVLVRTGAAREVGGYDEDLFLEDYDLWMRLASRFPFTHVPEALVSWREVSTSLGAQRFVDDGEWALTRIRMWAKHWGRDAVTDQVVTDLVRPLLLDLARRGVAAGRLAPFLREVARVDGRRTSRAYALASATGRTGLLQLLARARPPRRATRS